VDNEAKACLDEVALDLQRLPDAKAVLVGSSNAKEKEDTAKEAKRALKNKNVKVVDMAAQRAVNAKEYLVTDKGIDASRIKRRTSATTVRSRKTTWFERRNLPEQRHRYHASRRDLGQA